MAAVVTLIDDVPTTLISVKGIVLDGIVIEPRQLQRKVTKFWGVNNESHIYGGAGGRSITVPIIIYDVTDFNTARKVADYVNETLNGTALGEHGTLTVTSLSNHAAFADCTFDGFSLLEGPKHDDAGTLGGGYFAIGQLLFRQMS